MRRRKTEFQRELEAAVNEAYSSPEDDEAYAVERWWDRVEWYDTLVGRCAALRQAWRDFIDALKNGR